jgi:hypothetical protein
MGQLINENKTLDDVGCHDGLLSDERGPLLEKNI